LWRAPIDNDRVAAGLPTETTPAGRWRLWGLDRLVEEGRDGDTVRYAGGIAHRCTMTLEDDGSVVYDEEATIPDSYADLARVGSVLTLPAGYEAIEWFGPGPHETYPDRKRGAAVRRWTSTVTGQYVPYIRPQEHGGHEDVRWLVVGDLRFDFASEERPLHVSVSHFTAGDLADATHDGELRPRAETFVTIDAAHRGLGTASCGPDTLPRYLVRPGTYRWRWRLSGPASER
jgi:beta-galactosidase